AAGVSVEHVWILSLAAARAPAGRRSRRAEVGPLAEIGLAEDHGAGIAQAFDHERVRCRMIIRKRERAGGIHHAGDIDGVLEKDGNAVHRASYLPRLAFGVERRRL